MQMAALVSKFLASAPQRRLRSALGLIPLTVALSTVACAGAAQPGTFPTRDQLSKLTAAPPPANVFDKQAVDVDAFELVAPLPDAVDGSAVNPEGPWQKLLTSTVASKPGLVVASTAMECAARQVAAFVAEKNALPAPPIVRFVASRCGVPTATLGLAYRSVEADEKVTEESLVDRWSPDVKKDLEGVLGAGNRAAGIAFARSAKRAAVAVVTASRVVHLSKVPLVPASGKVILKGELLNPAESIRAVVTRGRFGFESCVKDVDLVLPQFQIECDVSPDDPSARIEVAAFPAGRELGDTVIDMRVYPAGSAAQAYTRAGTEDKEAPLDPSTEGATLVARINAIRKEAGLAEVRLSVPQTHTAAKLAPYFFAAVSGKLEPTVADTVALGLLAGWEVEGAVREGHFTAMWLGHRAPTAFVQQTIDSPFGRETLLDPAASVIAVGSISDDTTLGAVFSTYSAIETTQTDTTSAVLARLSKLRGKIKRAAPEAVPELADAMADAVARVESGTHPKDVLDRVTNKSAEAVPGSRVASWMVTTTTVEKLEYPSDLLSKGSLRLSVGVARYRPEGAPWTKLAVFFVAVEEPAANNTARTSAPHL